MTDGVQDGNLLKEHNDMLQQQSFLKELKDKKKKITETNERSERTTTTTTKHENQQDNDCSNATGRVGGTNRQSLGGAPRPPTGSSLPRKAVALAGCGAEGSQRRDP